ncbi:MAG: thermonuclease family protein [Chloroflexota bacterium]|nr:thermonuclease family protein [Chloroflexota bacterium]
MFGAFQVEQVIDGHSFAVAGAWAGATGKVVRVSDLAAPAAEAPAGIEAKEWLRGLIEGKIVVLAKPYAVDKYGRLVADVFLHNRNLADFLPESYGRGGGTDMPGGSEALQIDMLQRSYPQRELDEASLEELEAKVEKLRRRIAVLRSRLAGERLDILGLRLRATLEILKPALDSSLVHNGYVLSDPGLLANLFRVIHDAVSQATHVQGLEQSVSFLSSKDGTDFDRLAAERLRSAYLKWAETAEADGR